MVFAYFWREISAFEMDNWAVSSHQRWGKGGTASCIHEEHRHLPYWLHNEIEREGVRAVSWWYVLVYSHTRCLDSTLHVQLTLIMSDIIQCAPPPPQQHQSPQTVLKPNYNFETTQCRQTCLCITCCWGSRKYILMWTLCSPPPQNKGCLGKLRTLYASISCENFYQGL